MADGNLKGKMDTNRGKKTMEYRQVTKLPVHGEGNMDTSRLQGNCSAKVVVAQQADSVTNKSPHSSTFNSTMEVLASDSQVLSGQPLATTGSTGEGMTINSPFISFLLPKAGVRIGAGCTQVGEGGESKLKGSEGRSVHGCAGKARLRATYRSSRPYFSLAEVCGENRELEQEDPELE